MATAQRYRGGPPPVAWFFLGMVAMAVVGLALYMLGNGDDASLDKLADDFGFSDEDAGGSGCAEVFATGRPTDDVVDDYNEAPCERDGEVFVSAIADRACDGGRTLIVIEGAGYGFKGETWTAADESPLDLLDSC